MATVGRRWCLKAAALLVLTALGEVKAMAFDKDARIAIIGAGPSGIHMASQLRKMGYDHVTILEKTHRVGGKSFTLYFDSNGLPCEQQIDPVTGNVNTWDCITTEMGTTYLHNGYHIVRDLMAEYGLTPEVDVLERRYLSDKDHSNLPYFEWASDEVLALIEKGVVHNSWWVPSFAPDIIKAMDALVSALRRYISLHEEIMGELKHSLPDRLSPESLSRIDMTFQEFLDAHNLQAAGPLALSALSQQGYGRLDAIPAFYGLLWFSPELVNGGLQGSLMEQVFGTRSSYFWFLNADVRALVGLVVGSDATTSRYLTAMPEGYNKLWETMSSFHELDVRFGVEIAENGIDRHLDDAGTPVTIKHRRDGGAWVEEEFDFLLYAISLETADKYIKDLAQEESAIFSKFESRMCIDSWYRGDPIEGSTTEDIQAALTYWLDDYDVDGSWFGDRNTQAIFGRNYVPGSQTRVAFQYIADPCTYDPLFCDIERFPDNREDFKLQVSTKAKDQLTSDFDTYDVTGITFGEQVAWSYSPRLPLASITAGELWDIFEMQGSHKTWWLGGSTSFESVLHVCSYNLRLLEEYLGVPYEEEYPLPGYAASQVSFVLTILLLVITCPCSCCILCCYCCIKQQQLQVRRAKMEDEYPLLPTSPTSALIDELPAQGSGRCVTGFCC